MLRTDLLYRGVPWVRLLFGGRRAPGPHTLNVRKIDQLLTGLAATLIMLAGIGLLTGQSRWLVGAAGVVLVMIGLDWRLSRWFWQVRGWRFAAAAIPLRLLYFVMNTVAVALALLPLRWRRRLPERSGSEADILLESDPDYPIGDQVQSPVVPQPSGSL